MPKVGKDKQYDYDLAFDEAEGSKYFLVLRREARVLESWRVVTVIEEDEVLAKELLRDLRSGSRRAELEEGKELRQNVTELPRDR